jgi:DnaJ like chaperone protein
MEYRQHNQPGCGGCLFLFVLLVLLSGGNLTDVLGLFFYLALFFVLLLVGLFWGFSYFVRRQVANYERF